jgi:glutamine cyclotransferase
MTSVILAFLLIMACNQEKPISKQAESKLLAPAAIEYSIKVIKSYTHDSSAFTQGFYYKDGFFYEGTGVNGHSTLRKVELETGKVLKKKELAYKYFGEGIAELAGKIYQLTWINRTCIVYDKSTFEEVGKFDYDGEGWGLTTDGKQLIMSDGSNIIRFIRATDFNVTRTLSVTDNGIAIVNLNELEWIKGEIWANIWQTKKVAIINPENGYIRAWVDLSSLYDLLAYNDIPDVLNGIAYDAEKDKIYVTGKLWNKVYEIELIQK